MSFTLNDIKTGSYFPAPAFANTAQAAISGYDGVDFVNLALTQREQSISPLSHPVVKKWNSTFRNRLFKYHKRCKRIVNNVFLRVNSRTREITYVVLTHLAKKTYKNDHFLPHVHSFIFRLTPF